MIVETINRMARGVDYPTLVGPDSIALAADIGAPGTAWQSASYGMNGLGDFTVIGDYFTSTNYYLGFVAVAVIGYMLLGKPNKRALSRRAALKGSIARETELLKA